MQGQRAAGLAQLHQGLAAVLTTGQTLAQICLILLAEAAGHAGQVEEGLRRRAEARRPLAKSWELRAATSLARLWQQQGKRKEAHDLLTPIYGWFTEGVDTADRQEAQALLVELASGG